MSQLIGEVADLRASPGARDMSGFPGGTILTELTYQDTVNGGVYAIAGISRFDGVPGRALVYVFDPDTGAVVQSTRSGPNGVFAFSNLSNDREYLVVGQDEIGAYNATIKARIVPA